MKPPRDYRDYVGPRERYPLVGLAARDLLDAILPSWCDGPLLDVGCGSLRIGKELMPRLPRGAYCGIEPQFSVVEEALAAEHGGRIAELFAPEFSDNDRFDLSCFGRHFPVVIAYAVFIHCGRVQLCQCLRNIRAHVDEHGRPTSLVVDLRIEEEAKELRPASAKTGYEHASHNIAAYTREEVPGIFREHGAKLVEGDLHLSCDGRGIRQQHVVIFEP